MESNQDSVCLPIWPRRAEKYQNERRRPPPAAERQMVDVTSFLLRLLFPPTDGPSLHGPDRTFFLFSAITIFPNILVFTPPSESRNVSAAEREKKIPPSMSSQHFFIKFVQVTGDFYFFLKKAPAPFLNKRTRSPVSYHR